MPVRRLHLISSALSAAQLLVGTPLEAQEQATSDSLRAGLPMASRRADRRRDVKFHRFECTVFPEISFEFPAFNGWAVAEIQSIFPDRCSIVFIPPETMDFDDVPRVDLTRQQATLVHPARKTSMNRHGVRSVRSDLPGRPGLLAALGERNYLVSIQFEGSDSGFSSEAFLAKVAETFRIHERADAAGR